MVVSPTRDGTEPSQHVCQLGVQFLSRDLGERFPEHQGVLAREAAKAGVGLVL